MLAVVCVAGCATQTTNSSPADKSVVGVPQSREALSPASPVGDKSDLEKLAALWLKRSQEKGNSDLPIGVGDVVEISVPAIEELRSRTVRISGDGTIALPFIGKMDAAGLTEEELQQKLVAAHPQLLSLTSLGKSYEGRDIWCLAINNPKTGPEHLHLVRGSA